MKEKNSYSLARLCATLAAVLEVPAPAQAEPPLDWAVTLLQELAGGPVERALLYNPDAVAQWLPEKYWESFAPVRAHTQLTLPLRSPMPSVTPVCFGTMYTGAQPAIHGIQAYEKPVIAIDTLFDSLLRAGKRVALVAVANSSMAKIYNGRAIDYYFEEYDAQVEQKALALIAQDTYDFIAVYTQEYDDVMHATGVESPQAIAALQNQIGIFDRLCRQVEQSWQQHTTLVGWATDHGVHQQEDGHGNHGLDIAQDVNVLHYFGMINPHQP